MYVELRAKCVHAFVTIDLELIGIMSSPNESELISIKSNVILSTDTN